MDKQQLIQAIKQGFQEGKRKEELHIAFAQQGWSDRDIDEAIFSIQKEALKKIPGISHFFNWFDDPAVHSKITSPKASIFILGGIIAILAVATVLFNYFADPFGVAAAQRDQQRTADLEKIHGALDAYFSQYHAYPDALKDLQPDLLATIPQDPRTKDAYAYQPEDNGFNFQLCVNFEHESPICIYATPVAPIQATQPNAK